MAETSIDWPALLGDVAHLLGDPDPVREGQRVPAAIQRVADHLQVARGTLRGWLDGSEPRHTDGERLLLAWCRLSGKDRAFAPRERRPLTAHCR